MKKVIRLFLMGMILTLYSCGNGNDGNTIEVSGNIETTTIVVSSQVSGKVLQLLKDEGEKVKAGDTIIVIDPITYQLKLEEAAAALTAAEAQYQLLKNGARREDIQQTQEMLNQAELNFNSAEKDKERFENLYKSKAITKKQYDDAITRYDVSLAQFNSAKQNYKKITNLARPEELKQAEANVSRLKAALEMVKKSLADCYVNSPTDGIIVKQFIEAGETAGMLSSLFKVSDLSTVDLILYISETELGKVKLEQKVDVNVDSYPEKIFEGKIVFISPEAEFTPKNIQTKEERTKLVFAVKVKIDNKNYELKTGMPADALIKL
ncbi:MAG: efflux RND transporter periplasmic adaptor subunit [Ignavibacteriales bacterium]|nr:MAG: efflux RND transporter periplasmic adaptor subunit [Ignavibacteriales bacterium]